MEQNPIRSEQLDPSDPPVLIAILIAARRTGDRLLGEDCPARAGATTRNQVRFAP